MFHIDSELLHVLPTSLKGQSFGEGFFMTAFCQRQKLRQIPTDLSESTAMLYLAENELTDLNRSSFAKHSILTSLVLANNRIKSIASDTFIGLKRLEYLDLSGNQIETLPETTFCNWIRNHILPLTRCYDLVKADRENLNDTRKTLTMLIHGNPWHCTCYLQEFMLNYTCAYGDQDYCIKFKAMSQYDFAIGYCWTPTSLREVPLNKLMTEHISKPREQVVNLCLTRKTTVDIALIVVLFTWMGLSMAYVINFILWNNREVSRHKSYIQSLENTNRSTNEHREHVKKRNDSFSPEGTKPPNRNSTKCEPLLKPSPALPELALNDKLVSSKYIILCLYFLFLLFALQVSAKVLFNQSFLQQA
ncbi:leucine-rich repeat-containing protein 3B-like isoform X1 [Ciona intestinalis]